MSQAVIPFDAGKLAASLKQVSREAAPLASFLRMNKQGQWTYGLDATIIAKGTEFMVNPSGFQHGYICWSAAASEKLGETAAPVTDALPEPGPVPVGGRGWEFQLGMHLKGLVGPLENLELVYRASSVGGKRAVATLAEQVANRLVTKGETSVVPVIKLDTDSYKHKQYGTIFVPVLTIARWMQIPAGKVNGEGKGEAPKQAKPVKRKR